MKKNIFTLLFTFAAMGSSALPLDNPAEPALLCSSIFAPCKLPNYYEGFHFRFGFYGDYVFNRHLEVDVPGTPNIKKTEIYTNAAYIALNICNRIDCFTTLGTSRINLLFNNVLFSSFDIGSKVEMDTATNISWSFGLRGVVAKWRGFILGIEGQYFRNPSHLDAVFIAAIEPLFPFEEEHVTYSEWQVGVGLSYRINMAANGLTALVPYIGYKLSRANLGFEGNRFDDGSLVVTFEEVSMRDSRTYGGYAFGVTLVGCARASVTVEARFIEEKAFYVNGQIRF